MEEMPHSMPEVVSIVACGPSALKCGAASAPGHVIAVNDAYQHVRHDALLSMDGRWAMNRVPTLGNGPPLFLRRSAAAHCNPTTIALHERLIHLFDCDHQSDEFSNNLMQFNGPNSGYCALNLAYQMSPKIVYLFGYDHKGGHFHKESEWRQRGEGCSNSPRKFAEWSVSCYEARRAFDSRSIAVINTNPDSMVRAFEFGSAPCLKT